MEKRKLEILNFAFDKSDNKNFSTVLVELPIEYCRINDSRFRPGHTVHFIANGLMLSISERVEIGENLKIKIYFSSGSELTSIVAVVQVAWADVEKEEDGFYVFGVNFIDIASEDMDSLKSFLGLYADPQTPAEFYPSVGGCLNPHKPTPPGRSGQPAKIYPPTPTFLKGLLNFGRSAWKEFIG